MPVTLPNYAQFYNAYNASFVEKQVSILTGGPE